MLAYSFGCGRGGIAAVGGGGGAVAEGGACPVGVISVASSSESDESYSTRDIIFRISRFRPFCVLTSLFSQLGFVGPKGELEKREGLREVATSTSSDLYGQAAA